MQDLTPLSDAPPLVSVIVMTHERPDPLRRCLESLAGQTLSPSSFEVVVVDASEVPTSPVVEAFASRLRLTHHVIQNGGVAANRNTGVELARGVLVAFLDDDCIADAHWLARITAAAQRDHRLLVGGRVENPNPKDAVAAAGQVITEGVDRFFNHGGYEPRFLPGLNFALERQAYVAVGGCDVTFGRLAAEDRDFVDRWRLAGGRLLSCPEALVYHQHRSTLAGFLRQYFNYGRGAWRYHRLRRSRHSGRITEDLRLHLGLHRYLSPPVMRLGPAMRVKVIPLLVAWQAASAVGFVFQGVVETAGRALIRADGSRWLGARRAVAPRTPRPRRR